MITFHCLLDHTGKDNSWKSASYYCLYDGQGNIVQISNKVGDLPYFLFKYDSYGNTLETETDGDDSEPGGYKGYDQSAIYFKTGARHYDPNTGTFMTPDPFKGYMGDPPSQHLYMYCKGNPIAFSDPSGYFAYDGGENWWKNNHPKLYNALKRIETEAQNRTPNWMAFEYSNEVQALQNKYKVKFGVTIHPAKKS